MRKLLLVVAVAALCGGCAHKDLKAPCADKLASLNLTSANNIPCDNRQPVNLATLGVGWAKHNE